MESCWNGGHEVGGNLICRFRTTASFMGRHLINEARHLIVALFTQCAKTAKTQVIGLFMSMSGVSVLIQ